MIAKEIKEWLNKIPDDSEVIPEMDCFLGLVNLLELDCDNNIVSSILIKGIT